MADASKVFGIPIAPNQPSLLQLNHNLGLSVVEKILITWPPGCAGLVQCVVTYSGTPVYPNQTGQAFLFDDYTLEIDVTNQGNSGAWGVQVNNTDSIQHSLHVVYLFNYWVDPSDASTAQAVSI
jgi:hypothetical protein